MTQPNKIPNSSDFDRINLRHKVLNDFGMDDEGKILENSDNKNPTVLDMNIGENPFSEDIKLNQHQKSYTYKKNQKKKSRKKEVKLQKQNELVVATDDQQTLIEYPSELNNLEEFELGSGFERFSMELASQKFEKEETQTLKFNEDLPRKAISAAILESNHGKDEFYDENKMTKKKWKRLNRMSIGDLKLKVKNPTLVEPWDNCSRDPLFLLELKAKRGTVPVPRHWCDPGKYLQNKKGFVKPPFKLPDFIANTGIMEMRQTASDKEADKSLKNKMKDKIRPRVGLVDISYEKLYNAFFVEQTKPELSKFGDIYYQGKELEGQRKKFRPGVLSDELLTVLGMTSGPNVDKIPPPWLIAQQRYGPPPSYPNLKIPGLNAGIPQGCSFGYHIGGWGKPPIGDDGQPLYGDVFENSFTSAPILFDIDADEDDDKYWGEIESAGEESETENEDEEEEEEGGNSDIDEDEESDNNMNQTNNFILRTESSNFDKTGSISNSIELRKKTKHMEDNSTSNKINSEDDKKLFQVLPEVKANIGSNIMGSEKIYSFSRNESKIQLQKRKNDSQDKTEPKAKKHKEFKF